MSLFIRPLGGRVQENVGEESRDRGRGQQMSRMFGEIARNSVGPEHRFRMGCDRRMLEKSAVEDTEPQAKEFRLYTRRK